MSLFKEMLSNDDTIFKNEIALDFNFIPKIVPYRESQQRFVASCIKPLFNNQNGQNVLIHGIPAVGKTVALRHILQDLEEQTDDILPVYVNCWQKNSIHKIATEMCEQLGQNLYANQKTDEILRRLFQFINRKSIVLVLDEVDKLEDHDFIYSVLEEIYRKSLVLITNYKEWIVDLDTRIKSRLMAQVLEFPSYNEIETKGIIKQRINYAFVSGTWNNECIDLVTKKTFDFKDIRTGLNLIRQAALTAESESSKIVTIDHVKKAIDNFSQTPVRDSGDLEEECKFVLKIVKGDSGKKIGDLYKTYTANGGKSTYKTFQRKIKKLQDGKFISTKKIIGGTAGSTTIVNYIGKNKKLNEF